MNYVSTSTEEFKQHFLLPVVLTKTGQWLRGQAYMYDITHAVATPEILRMPYNTLLET
jgi:hypothetical protein